MMRTFLKAKFSRSNFALQYLCL